MSRRVVVTGLGAISPLGIGVEATWRQALAGKSGIRLIEDFDTTDFATKFAGLVPNFPVTDYIPAKEVKK